VASSGPRWSRCPRRRDLRTFLLTTGRAAPPARGAPSIIPRRSGGLTPAIRADSVRSLPTNRTMRSRPADIRLSQRREAGGRPPGRAPHAALPADPRALWLGAIGRAARAGGRLCYALNPGGKRDQILLLDRPFHIRNLLLGAGATIWVTAAPQARDPRHPPLWDRIGRAGVFDTTEASVKRRPREGRGPVPGWIARWAPAIWALVAREGAGTDYAAGATRWKEYSNGYAAGGLWAGAGLGRLGDGHEIMLSLPLHCVV
jgi:hypothetical protein